MSEVQDVAVPVAPVAPDRNGFSQEVEAQLRAAFTAQIAGDKPVEKIEEPLVAAAVPAVVETKETAVQDEPAPVAAKVTDEDYEQAVKALRFAKYTTKDLEALGHDRVVALGKEHHKVQSEVSKRFEESAARVKALEEAAAAKAPERNDKGQFVAPTKDLAAAVKLTAQALLNAEDPEDALTKFHEASTAPIRAELQETKGYLQQVIGIVFDLQANSARGQLPERIRTLVDDKTFAEVMVPKARSLMASGEYTSVGDALYDSVPRSIREAIDAGNSSESARKSAARENGQLTPVDRRPTAKIKSPEERLKAAYLAAQRPDATEADVRSAMFG